MSQVFSLDTARKAAGLLLARMERMSGTGASATIRLTGILKFAPDRTETDLLQWLQDKLGSDFATFFPRFREIGKVDDFFVTELEYLSDATFESVLVGNGQKNAFDPKDIVNRVTGIINRLATVTVPFETSKVSQKAFLDEIIEGLSRNARVIEPTINLNVMKYMKLAAFISCLCHRDLSTSNVMCTQDGGVRLIDPRYSVPGATARDPSFGSIAVDAAAFIVSLERKELERERAGRSSLHLTEHFQSAVNTWMSNGMFNALMFDLCLAYIYSVYGACHCEYCLASERKWLYDLMQKRFKESLSRIA